MLLQHSVIRKSFKDDGCATRLYKAERDKCLLLEMKNFGINQKKARVQSKSCTVQGLPAMIRPTTHIRKKRKPSTYSCHYIVHKDECAKMSLDGLSVICLINS